PALAQSAVGTWSVATETPNGKREATMTVTQSGGSYTVAYQPVAPAGGAGGPPPGAGAGGPPPASTISDVVGPGDQLAVQRGFSGPQGAIEITYDLTVAGDAISGTSKSSFGEGKVTGARKK